MIRQVVCTRRRWLRWLIAVQLVLAFWPDSRWSAYAAGPERCRFDGVSFAIPDVFLNVTRDADEEGDAWVQLYWERASGSFLAIAFWQPFDPRVPAVAADQARLYLRYPTVPGVLRSMRETSIKEVQLGEILAEGLTWREELRGGSAGQTEVLHEALVPLIRDDLVSSGQLWMVFWSELQQPDRGGLDWSRLERFLASFALDDASTGSAALECDPVPVGAVLLADDFSDPDASWLRPLRVARVGYDYADQSFGVHTEPRFGLSPNARVPGRYDAASLSIDFMVETVDSPVVVTVNCREIRVGSVSYALSVRPADGTLELTKFEPAAIGTVIPPTPGRALATGDGWNRVTLECTPSSIKAWINDEPAFEQQYQAAASWSFSISTSTEPRGLASTVRFDNVLVTQAGE